MKRHMYKVIKNGIIVVLLIALTSFLRFIDMETYFENNFKKCIIFSVYELMCVAWGISIMKRIMNNQVRKYLISADVLMAFWFVVRTLKWFVFQNPAAVRFLWYLFYVPQLGIVYCAFGACECVVERDSGKGFRERMLAFFATLLLVIMMVTNEYHNFAIKVDPVTGKETHWFGYYMIVIWMALLLLITVAKLYRKNEGKNTENRSKLPYCILFAGMLYCMVYFFKSWKGYTTYLEFTVGFTVYSIFFFESLIITGLIPSNIDYEWCFMHAGLKAQVLNKGGKTVYESAEARTLTKDEVRELLSTGKSFPNADTELQAVEIRGGYVVWERDIKDINRSIYQFMETGESIKEATQTLEENISVEKRRKAIKEQNRLYDITFSLVSDKLAYLHELIDTARNLEGKELADTLKTIDICGVYLKRKSNLILLSEQTLLDFTGELKLCFKESFDNLSDAGIEAKFLFNNVIGIDYSLADNSYAFLEEILERTIKYLAGITVILAGDEKKLRLTTHLSLQGGNAELLLANISESFAGVDFEAEENQATVSYTMTRGGGGYANL